MSEPKSDETTARIAFGLLVCGTALGLAGTDLILPAIPSLPNALGGSPALAQLVLATFVAGTGIGLIGFGELGARFDQRGLLIGSLMAYALLSAAALLAPNLEALIVLRFAQGAAGAAAAVFAPGIIRHLFDDKGSVKALGLLASIESVVPALAPLIGVYLLMAFGWQGSFVSIALLSALIALAVWALRSRLPAVQTARKADAASGYGTLAMDTVFLRYALSQAFTLGALLIFVFGAPSVITGSLGGQLSDFIVLQICGVSFFIFGANIAGRLSERWGAETVIMGGSALSAIGAVFILFYGLVGGTNPLVLAALFVPMNLGLGFRGPPGFFHAVLASKGDDARGAALVLLAVLLTTAGGTALAAPFITQGLVPLTAIAAGVSILSVVLLFTLPKIEAPGDAVSAR